MIRTSPILGRRSTRRGGATLNFEEFSPHVLPLAGVRSEQDIEALAKEISEYVQGASV